MGVCIGYVHTYIIDSSHPTPTQGKGDPVFAVRESNVVSALLRLKKKGFEYDVRINRFEHCEHRG